MKAFLFTWIALVVLSPLAAHADIGRFSKVEANIYRGAQPQNVSDYQQLQQLGVHTIINLRTTPDAIQAEAQVAQALNMSFVSYPIDGMSYPNEVTVNAILADLQNPQLFPIFIHCNAGQDRTGLIIGLFRVKHDHWNPNDAYNEMLSNGFTEGLVGLKQYFWDHVH